VGASTSTAATNGPMSFPQRHALCGPGADAAYDYTLGLETGGAQASIIGPALAKIAPARDTLDIGFGGISSGNAGNGGGRAGRGGRGNSSAPPVEADAEASLPVIIEAVKLQLTPDQKARIQERIAKHARANHDARVEALTKAVDAKRAGWTGSPISTARIYAGKVPEAWVMAHRHRWARRSPRADATG
jgi:hypothetical protein